MRVFYLLFLIFTSCSLVKNLPFIGTSNTFQVREFTLQEIHDARYSLDLKTVRKGTLPAIRTFLNANPLIAEVKQLPDFKLEMNNEVRNAIIHFRKNDNLFVRLGLKRKASYKAMLNEVFREEGVPLELLSVAHVESIYDFDAKSKSGALGLWQFMPKTAEHYGLKVGFFTDQRKSAVYSTIAASRYLRDLYDQFQDWHLALAAYNCGPSRVKKAIRIGKTRNFWLLSRKRLLSRQTRNYVPKIIAIALIEKNPGKFGFRI